MLPGLYIHIPFCRHKCNYCDFYFTTFLNQADSFTEALLQEIDLYAKNTKFQKREFDTVYLGGGTPSVLGLDRISKILDKIRQSFTIVDNVEITIEVNPDSAKEDFLKEIKALGFTRISIGVQTFDDQVLRWMNRGHTAQESCEAITHAKQLNFSSVNIDLMHSIPEQSLSDYELSLKKALQFYPDHFSIYSLTIESNTPLEKQVHEGKVNALSEDTSASMMRFTQALLKEAGYTHYELSNYAKSHETRSQHNQKYWNFIPYLGLGPSAHSFDGKVRSWNVRNLQKYIEMTREKEFPIEASENIDQEKRFHEEILLGLRKAEGFDFFSVCQEFQLNPERFQEPLNSLIDEGFLKQNGTRIFLTEEGFLVYNSIVRSLMECANFITERVKQ